MASASRHDVGSINEQVPSVLHDLYPAQRRRFPRRRIEAAVAVCGVASNTTSRTWRGHALNLSEGGAGIIVAGAWLPGQVVRIELAIGQERMELVARIAHRHRLYCGLEFLANSDQSRSQLHQLLAG